MSPLALEAIGGTSGILLGLALLCAWFHIQEYRHRPLIEKRPSTAVQQPDPSIPGLSDLTAGDRAWFARMGWKPAVEDAAAQAAVEKWQAMKRQLADQKRRLDDEGRPYNLIESADSEIQQIIPVDPGWFPHRGDIIHSTTTGRPRKVSSGYRDTDGTALIYYADDPKQPERRPADEPFYPYPALSNGQRLRRTEWRP